MELAASEQGIVTVPIAQQADVIWEAKTPERLHAPIQRGQAIGQAVISIKNKVLQMVPLVADRDIPRAGFLKRTVHTATLLTMDYGKELIATVVLLGAAVGVVWYLRQRRPRHSARQ